ncbi:MAG: hypothetical protein MI866_22010, partial [Bacteroidales bacterium]|nr:hypothetical protein [Bacteroidales bacterium]
EKRALCWRNTWHDEYAVRKGKWKLYHEKGISYLYKLSDDNAEAIDLKVNHPDKLSELEEVYKEWEAKMPFKQTLFGKQLLKHSL